MESILNKNQKLLLPSVRLLITSNKLLRKGSAVVIGVSGGPDSVALLHILVRLRYDLGIKIIVGHFNHQLRRESPQDEKFVVSLAGQLGLPVFSARPKRACPRHGSVEDWARQERFQFLLSLAKRHSAATIALAHTQDDLAETVLMRILRGAGLLGLRAILLERQMEGVNVIRPFLHTRKSDLVRFLDQQRLPYRIDRTNLKMDFFRNKIRLKLLPLLEKEYNLNITHVLANVSNSVSVDYDFIKSEADQLLKFAAKPINRNSIHFGISALSKMHLSLQRMMFRLAFEYLKGDLKSLTLDHIDGVRDLLDNRPVGTVVDFPSGVSILKTKTHLEFKKVRTKI